MKYLLIIIMLFTAITPAQAADEITAYKAKDGTLFESKEKAEAHDKRKELLIATYKAFGLDPIDDPWVYRAGSTGDHCRFIINNAHEIYRILKPFCEEKRTNTKLPSGSCLTCGKIVIWTDVEKGAAYITGYGKILGFYCIKCNKKPTRTE